MPTATPAQPFDTSRSTGLPCLRDETTGLTWPGGRTVGTCCCECEPLPFAGLGAERRCDIMQVLRFWLILWHHRLA
jgi:hypothetical protein